MHIEIQEILSKQLTTFFFWNYAGGQTLDTVWLKEVTESLSFEIFKAQLPKSVRNLLFLGCGIGRGRDTEADQSSALRKEPRGALPPWLL